MLGVTAFNMLDFIESKRDGLAHSGNDMDEFVRAVCDGTAPDYQVAAWLMAVVFRGLSNEELIAFTSALARSGDIVSFPPGTIVVDKHSTGGVGDKTTFVAAPIAAACGVKVAKLSGRGLGYTGGTVDKMESLQDMDMHLSSTQFIDQVMRTGIALSGHSIDLAPAEGRFYSLRDVTGTVPSIPLIASSIVSKKIAGGGSAFVFDIKCGSGAFMKTLPDAQTLSAALVSLSKALGKESVCIISDMSQPLGEWIGNSAELAEAIEVLSGRGPGDTGELSVALAAEMLVLGGVTKDIDTALKFAAESLNDGSALEKFRSTIREQGGDASVCDDPWKILAVAANKQEIKAESGGFVEKLDAMQIGKAVRMIGGGRVRKGDEVDRTVAVRLLKKRGSAVERGDTIAEIYYTYSKMLPEAADSVLSAFAIGGTQRQSPLILGRVE